MSVMLNIYYIHMRECEKCRVEWLEANESRLLKSEKYMDKIISANHLNQTMITKLHLDQ